MQEAAHALPGQMGQKRAARTRCTAAYHRCSDGGELDKSTLSERTCQQSYSDDPVRLYLSGLLLHPC
jgi:hypothetical protein